VTYHFYFSTSGRSLSARLPPMPVDDDSSPPPKGRKPLPVAVYLTPSPPVQARIKRVHHSPAAAQVAPRLPNPSGRRFQQQADEDSDGRSSAQGSNSTDDADEADLSCVSLGSQHPNAEQHIYAAGASSQGGYPTPMHERRGADKGILTLAGDIPPFVTYHISHPPAQNPLS
jgi:hypothetical protein